MATFTRCTRADGRPVYVNLDMVLSMERVQRINMTVLGLSARLLDGDLSLEVREEPQNIIPVTLAALQ